MPVSREKPAASITTSNARTPHVALLVETSTSWGAGIIRGVARWVESFGPWTLYFEPRGRYEKPRLPSDWHGQGIIARVNSRELAEELLERKIPCVDVSCYEIFPERIARCSIDEQITGRIAAEYFLERGYRDFAYVSASYRSGRRDRVGEAFQAEIQARNGVCRVFTPGVDAGEASGHEMLERYSAWVAELPKPTAMVTFDSATARQITEACRLIGVAVPEQIAILAAEHDELCAELSRPRLSTIDHLPQRVGYEAAGLLAELMSGATSARRRISLPPQQVVTRASTDTLAIENPLMVRALRYIHDHFHEPIRVRHILTSVPMSRRSLEQLFQQTIHRSPATELTRVRVERAKDLLVRTDLTLATIATRCGFEYAEVLTRVFQRTMRQTPSAFRKEQRIK